MPVILLDPGHSEGSNRSPVVPEYSEGTSMWRLSQMLAEKLTQRGCAVHTTRPEITDDPSLYERGTMAGRLGADLFLSLHSNMSSKNPDGSYDEQKRGVVSIYSQTDIAFNRPLSERFSQTVSTLMKSDDLGSFYSDYPNRPGVDYFGVLRYAAASGCRRAIIIEHGYHTNRENAAWLLDEGNLALLASAEAQIIAETFPVDEKKPLYRVQVGAYIYKVNADREAARLREKGFDCYISYSFSDGFYRVQAGAYYSFDGAKRLAERLQAQGFDTYISVGTG